MQIETLERPRQQPSRVAECATASPIAGGLRRALTSPPVLIGVGIAVVVGGLASGWGWLTAIGLAPIILSLAPCLVMCALGMCVMGKACRSAPPPIDSGNPGADPDARR